MTADFIIEYRNDTYLSISHCYHELVSLSLVIILNGYLGRGDHVLRKR